MSQSCRHCGYGRVIRPRGLCWKCYYAPGVREMYQPVSKYARLGTGNRCRKRLPDAPTDTLPGTEERMRVLAERARKGHGLFHPDDAKRGLE